MIEILKRIFANIIIKWLSSKVDRLNNKIDKAQEKLDKKLTKRKEELEDDVWSDI